MERCSPVQTRINLGAAKELASAGIDFVPVPVSCEEDREALLRIFNNTMNIMALQAEKEESSIAKNNALLAQLEEKGDE